MGFGDAMPRAHPAAPMREPTRVALKIIVVMKVTTNIGVTYWRGAGKVIIRVMFRVVIRVMGMVMRNRRHSLGPRAARFGPRRYRLERCFRLSFRFFAAENIEK